MPEHDAPQSRNEAILQNILGEHNELLEPQSRNEAILQAILYGDSYTEDAQSRIETLLLCILNGTTTDLEPLSRNEEILIAKINGGTYDKEPQSRIEELLIEWLNAFVEKTVTGAVCSFDDAIAGQPLIDLTAQIVATQSGTGDPSPSNIRPISGFTGVNVTRAGKNLFEADMSQDGNNRVILYDNKFLQVGTYALSLTTTNVANFYMKKHSESNWTNVGGYNKTQVTITITDAGYYDISYYISTGVSASDISNVQIETGTTWTDYEPYNGTTYSVSWQTEAGTVYGGYINLTTGVLTVTHTMCELTGADVTAVTTEGGLQRARLTTSGELSSASHALMKCNMYKPQVTAGEDVITWVSASQKVIWIYDSSFTNLKTTQSILNSSHVILVYPLATPQTYQLTPTEVLALLGVNNIYSNTGNTTVKYKARR